MKTALSVFFILITSFCFSQEEKLVYSSRQITFYGFDFSLFRYVDPDKVVNVNVNGLLDPTNAKNAANASKIKNESPVAWNTYFFQERPEKALRKQFKKDSVYIDLSCVLESAKNINEQTFIDAAPIKLSTTQIQEVINSYKIDKPKTTIGLVCVVENFIKSTKYKTHAETYYVFFNISDRKILMIDRVNDGDAGGWTFRKYWGIALIRNSDIYFHKFYKKRLSKYK